MSGAAAITTRLAAIDVRPGRADESQSGLQLLRPRIYGALVAPAAATKRAVVVMHPASNFMGHYLLAPLAQRGIAALGLNSRYAGNDTMLLMERVLQDLGAGVAWLRERGFAQVLLVGNSGGAALAAFYAAQSEKLTADRFPDGDATQLSPQDLPPVQGLVLSAAHLGRSRLLAEWLDPSLTDERDPLSIDPALDLYAPGRPLPLDAGFVRRFRGAQVARRDRIEAWVIDRLNHLRARAATAPGAPRDEVFLMHRTHADPRFVCLTLDANDRPAGSLWGDPRTVNFAANALGRVTSLTAFLSQWSSRSAADGPANLARCSHPVLHFTHSADQSTFPSTHAAWQAAAGARFTDVELAGANHYLAGQPQFVQRTADEIAAFAER